MKRLLLLLLLATGAGAEPVTLEDLIGEVDEDVVSNIVAVAAKVTGADEKALAEAAHRLQAELAGEYAVPVAPLRDLGLAVLPWLGRQAETRVFVAPLRQFLDEYATEEELRFELRPPPLQLPATPALTPLGPAIDLTPTDRQPPWRKRGPDASWSARAREWVPQLKPVFEDEGVPAELVWLAEVESGFNPRAKSRVGATGLYQLMPETAESLGLSVGILGDDRLDPQKNARAGARYLRYLHVKFRDWRLALAAYNGGEGRVRRLLDQRAARTFAAIAPALPLETRLYVPRVESVLLQREGVMLSELPAAR
jgi:membrane-bound lytic murein transglycosylase D